ncbi:methylcrotonoyl-CoA carboxylase subunit alpha, mitochondrial-like isoform X1 [Actinidia eriantha]|uniref:methylcrotonoyl-CoA carboxylase subunit alpha, mitochondrial-like isoform X1 n=1 Tax=Actinidia eriantha TaxID=165200 RepID=UPI002586CFCA|nr:methylcrotonoyl-CoA carboxylase subunit alpha, mitochondrial-like isoform X1 [Actinidia eriantha]
MKSSNIQSIVAKILFEVVPASTHNIRLDKSFSCHAFEDRTYAENVPKGFLLATEVFHHYHPVPISATAVRVETEVEQGDTVSMQYDPMIAKLVVWGENRAAALVKLKDCLCQSSWGLSVWYAHPPFRVHHHARRTMELEWVNEYSSSCSKSLTIPVTYQPDGSYFIETGESSSPGLEVKVAHLGDHEFRVQADGVSMDVSLAVYSKCIKEDNGCSRGAACAWISW